MSFISKRLARELTELGVRIEKDYDGRFMFGRTCFGLVVDDIHEVSTIAIDLSRAAQKEFREVLRAMRRDSLGLSYIAYFPGHQWPEGSV